MTKVSQMGLLPDLTPLFYLAAVGLIALIAGGVGGLTFAIWFVINHIQIV